MGPVPKYWISQFITAVARLAAQKWGNGRLMGSYGHCLESI